MRSVKAMATDYPINLIAITTKQRNLTKLRDVDGMCWLSGLDSNRHLYNRDNWKYISNQKKKKKKLMVKTTILNANQDRSSRIHAKSRVKCLVETRESPEEMVSSCMDSRYNIKLVPV